MVRLYLTGVFILILIFACQKSEIETPTPFPELMDIPPGFPEIEFPEDNTFSPERWTLGKKLFFDPVLSVDSSVSCASCHLPELAFSDEVSFSKGVADRPGTRNSPSLANVAYHPYFTREGGVPTLEMQTLVPIQEHNEFDFNILLIAERLNQLDEYVTMSQNAYGRTPDAFVITRAIANFERSLISGLSAYDLYAFQNKEEALSTAAKRGMDLFFSDQTNCSFCHGGFLFTNFEFENNGLYEVYEDPGRQRLTTRESDRARFKVPSLRNIAVTAPYMHDGSIESLEEVIDHYISGGSDHFNKNPKIRPLQITTQEKSDLIQFLWSLTDETFLSNPNYKNN